MRKRYSMIPVYSVVGYSGAGKTVFLEKLIPELRGRGLSLAVVKHDSHNFEIDKEGKDSWRFAQAGADVVAVVSRGKAALIEYRDIGLDGVLNRIRDVDLILTEGYKNGDYKKIAICRKGSDYSPIGAPDGMFAIVTDLIFVTDTPCFALDDASGLADLICEDLNKK